MSGVAGRDAVVDKILIGLSIATFKRKNSQNVSALLATFDFLANFDNLVVLRGSRFLEI